MALAYLEAPASAGGRTAAAAAAVDKAAAPGRVDQYRYLLLLRFGLLNITALALVAGAYMAGWLDNMIVTDKYHLVKLNIAVFIFGMAQVGYRVTVLSGELNELFSRRFSEKTRVGHYLHRIRGLDGTGRAALAESLKMKLGVRLGTIRHIASTIVLIGLIGTVIGFIIALSGVDTNAAQDASAVAPMITTLLFGMSIALYKTLVGSVLNVWLMANYRLLESGTVHLVTGAIEFGEERHARL